MVINTINKSEEAAEKRSIDGYVRVIEDDKANFEMTNPGKKYDMYETKADGSKKLKDYEYKGNKVFCENQYFDDKDKLVLDNCYVSEKELEEEAKAKKNIYSYINGKIELIRKGNSSSENNNSNNSTNNNKEFTIGEEVTVKNEKYNVIGQGSDYVTLLKQQPLTVDEVNTYGGVGTNNNHVNMYVDSVDYQAHDWSVYHQAHDWNDTNHSGGMAYYSSSTCGYVTPGDSSSWTTSGCTTSYNDSEVKYVVDGWVSNKFSINDLKTVDGYSARLVQLSELQQFYPNCTSERISSDGWCELESTTPIWLYNSNYWYWTMSQYLDFSSNVWHVDNNGDLFGNFSVYSGFYGAVRPVINVYKSKIGS